MANHNLKYSKERIQEAVKNSYSWSNVLKLLGIKQSGGMHGHLKIRAKKEGINYSHFTGYKWYPGKTPSRKFSADNILIKHENFYRTPGHKLKRALIERGVEYVCCICKLNEWLGQKLTLDVDHINGNNKDDRQENLRFLCPNCHSLTPTYKSKKRVVV